MIALIFIGAFCIIGPVCAWLLLRELLPELGGIFSPFTWRKRR